MTKCGFNKYFYFLFLVNIGNFYFLCTTLAAYVVIFNKLFVYIWGKWVYDLSQCTYMCLQCIHHTWDGSFSLLENKVVFTMLLMRCYWLGIFFYILYLSMRMTFIIKLLRIAEIYYNNWAFLLLVPICIELNIADNMIKRSFGKWYFDNNPNDVPIKYALL